jgi:hypothetical protein
VVEKTATRLDTSVPVLRRFASCSMQSAAAWSACPVSAGQNPHADGRFVGIRGRAGQPVATRRARASAERARTWRETRASSSLLAGGGARNRCQVSRRRAPFHRIGCIAPATGARLAEEQGRHAALLQRPSRGEVSGRTRSLYGGRLAPDVRHGRERLAPARRGRLIRRARRACLYRLVQTYGPGTHTHCHPVHCQNPVTNTGLGDGATTKGAATKPGATNGRTKKWGWKNGR